ncbi:MAG: PEP-CTERM sorting domain-containing protein [Sphingomonadaceae bacterium]|nr:PEP-CTERM sorting domain-containing protein [Sphingomonadaceae bacterium]
MAMAGAAQAATLYSQPYDNTGNLLASQNDTTGGNGNFATAFDDFTLASGGNITGLSFTGGYFNPPTVGNITGFTVKFYANNAGQPGGALSTTTVAGNAGESCAGTICTYALAANFSATAGTKYWMSIVPDLGFPPQWGWATSAVGNGVAYQDFLGTRSALPNDFAFTLTGNAAVPEPAAWAMMLVGFGLAGTALRSRRQSKVVTA